MQDIASAAALTRDLFNMQNLSAVNVVLAALGRAAVKGLDVTSLKAAEFDASACAAVGFGWADMKTAGFTAIELKAAGCDITSAKAAGYNGDLISEAFGLEHAIAAGCDVSFVLVS
jgi:hypothetical protein